MGTSLLEIDWREGPPDYSGEFKLPEGWELEFNNNGTCVLFWLKDMEVDFPERRYSIDTRGHSEASEGAYVVDTWEQKEPNNPHSGRWEVLAVCESAAEAYAVLMLHVYMN